MQTHRIIAVVEIVIILGLIAAVVFLNYRANVATKQISNMDGYFSALIKLKALPTPEAVSRALETPPPVAAPVTE